MMNRLESKVNIGKEIAWKSCWSNSKEPLMSDFLVLFYLLNAIIQGLKSSQGNCLPILLTGYQHFIDCQSTFGQQMAYKQLSFQQIVNKAVGQQLVNCQPTVGQQVIDNGPTIARLLADCWWRGAVLHNYPGFYFLNQIRKPLWKRREKRSLVISMARYHSSVGTLWLR